MSGFLFVCICAIRPIILFPPSIMALTSGLIFGPVLGVLYTFLGESISSMISYSLGYYFGKDFLNQYENSKLGKMLYSKRIHENPFFSVLILRLSLLPFDPVCYLSGALHIRFKSYLLATILGIIPGCFTFVYLGASFSEPINLIITFLSLFLAIGLKIFGKRTGTNLTNPLFIQFF
ncbi:VTT domain-containing protein [bacterium]|nr:VTT domain-containing protein [bacterium]